MIQDYLFNSDYINLLSYISISEYKKDSIVFSEGEICEKLGIVISGKILVSTLTQSDKEYIITTLERDDFFGDSLLFSTNNKYLGDGIAAEDSTIIFINKQDLLTVLSSNKNLLEAYLKHTSNKSMALKNQVKLLSQKNIRERILFYLSLKSKELGTNTIPIDSKESLSQYLSIPRPSLSRELINMQEEGIITFGRKSITIK